MSKSLGLRAPIEIVATIGPASWDLAAVLVEAGADALRLNASHMDPDRLAQVAADIRHRGVASRIIVDLQGAKMRLGDFSPLVLREGARLKFAVAAGAGVLSLSHPEIYSAAQPGDTLSCDDDRIRFRIVSVAADVLDVIVLRGGTLRPRKGINVVEHPVQLERLSSADLASVEASAHSEPVAYAFSFMKDGNEADWIRRIVPHAPVIGKLERHEAIINVAAIAGAVDAIWVCRGDLGAQLGLGPMARWVSGFDPRTMPCPVSMAGQVLEHVTAHAVPTRAEVCNICDLVARGYRGFVLSDETATGTDPAGAVRTLRTLLCEMQEP